jgi:MFS family permease
MRCHRAGSRDPSAKSGAKVGIRAADSGISAIGTTAALSLCLVANLAALMTFPSVLPQVSEEWQLSASEAGWIGGIYFAGYASAVPLLSSAADRFDGRWIVAGSSLLGASASFAFAALADGFWLALFLRFLGGVALAGVHMPGLVLLVERTEGREQRRGAAVYTSSHALGSASSFLIAGLVDMAFGWRATFVVGGLCPLVAVAIVARLPPAPSRRRRDTSLFQFRSVLGNNSFMGYVLAFAGNTWEVFGIRVWFVACLAYSMRIPGNDLALPNLALLSGMASLAGVPVSIAIAELADRFNRARVIIAVCVLSVATCLALAANVGGMLPVVLALLVLLQITSFADVGALGAGAISLADPARRGAALAVYGFVGFATGFLGPTAVGIVLDGFGGVDSASGWRAAFLTLALGSTVAAIAVWAVRDAGATKRT